MTMRKHAFTLVELLVVIAVLALLAATLLPALAKTSPNTKALQCMNNHRQLVNAWRMYADDNHDLIVYASDNPGGNLLLNTYAWTGAHMDFNGNNRANWDPTADMIIRPLWQYGGKTTAIFKCPSDISYVVIGSGFKPRIRSVSMNLFLGGFAGSDGGTPDLYGYRILIKTTDLTSPGPSKTFVFLDQRADSINWGGFLTQMQGYSPNQPTSYEFSDVPGLYHNLGCTFSFADGRVEIKRWQDSRTTPPSAGSSVVASPNNPDIAWLQDHATRPK
jgi:prepilin-type N-terminal cleavage/methylation domain-containing protein/prepilin-type processing-associated H-X9-DG protein